MKKYFKNLFLFSITFCSCSSFLSTQSESLQYYRTAINYFKNDSTANIFIRERSNDSLIKIEVSPKILPPNLGEFGSIAIKHKLHFDLDKQHFSYDNYISDSLIKYEEHLFYEPYINDEMVSLTLANNCNAIVFFSKVYNNFLTAMLFTRDKKLLNTELPKYHASLNYLIIFKEKKVDKVLKQIMSP